MRCHLCVAAALAVFASASLATATTITYVGQTFDNNDLPNWRTASEAKTLDLDGDDIYGTAGYLAIGTATAGTGDFQEAFPSGNGAYTLDTGNLETLSSLPAGVTVANGFLPINRVVSGDFYPLVDDPTGGPDRRIGFALNDIFNANDDDRNGVLSEFTIGASTPGVGNPNATLRVGVGLSNDPNLNVSDFMRVQVQGQANSGVIENESGDFGTTVMFFDVTDYEAGDVIEIWPYGRDEDGRSRTHYNLVTFDIVIPEPASALAGTVGLGLLAARRRR